MVSLMKACRFFSFSFQSTSSCKNLLVALYHINQHLFLCCPGDLVSSDVTTCSNDDGEEVRSAQELMSFTRQSREACLPLAY